MVPNVVSAHGGMAVYRQIAGILRARIGQGEYPPGHVLPSEHHLAVEFGVGRDSIRDALAALRAEGLIETRRGYRSRIREPRERVQVEIAPGDTVTARMPTPEERVERDVFEGVPMLVVGDRAYPADRYELVVR